MRQGLDILSQHLDDTFSALSERQRLELLAQLRDRLSSYLSAADGTGVPAARLYGQICAAVRAAGREPRRRASDLMIAATAASNQLPLYTANPDDFKGTEGLVEVVGIRARPNNL